jgi:signal transduction histidine kinase
MEAIGRLAGGVAHDMNNALAAILGIAEDLASTAEAAQVRDDAGQIVEVAQRAADLTRNLLGFSRRGQYRRERLRVEALVGSVVTLLTRTLPKGISVVTSVADDLVAFEGDASLLSHALVNLCLNASDAMKGEGVLTVDARLVVADLAPAPELTPGRYVVVSVRDTGAGIDAATRARLFEPFFTTKELGYGTGLGLAMVYGTVKRHDGAIVVDSEVGRGSTFSIYLPVVAGEAVVARAAAVAVPVAAPVAAARGARVLVVDDEAPVRGVVARVLTRDGYAVVEAADARRPWRCSRARPGPSTSCSSTWRCPASPGRPRCAPAAPPTRPCASS